jgi:hypothetical protein
MVLGNCPGRTEFSLDFTRSVPRVFDASERSDARLGNPRKLCDPVAELLQMVAETENAALVYDSGQRRTLFQFFRGFAYGG